MIDTEVVTGRIKKFKMGVSDPEFYPQKIAQNYFFPTQEGFKPPPPPLNPTLDNTKYG